VLTAYHCLEDGDADRVLIGANKLSGAQGAEWIDVIENIRYPDGWETG
jgi:hypothetical protein